MSECGNISSNILLNCDYPMVGGANDRLVLINMSDWEDATISRNASNNQLIEQIVLPSGSDAYNWEGKNNSVEPRQALVKQRYAEVFDHEVTFKVFRADADTKAQLEKLSKGRFIGIIQNNHRDENGKASFEIYGENVGLEAQEIERTIADAETQGAFNIVLRTPEQVKESHLPASLFNINFATTKDIVDALL